MSLLLLSNQTFTTLPVNIPRTVAMRIVSARDDIERREIVLEYLSGKKVGQHLLEECMKMLEEVEDCTFIFN